MPTVAIVGAGLIGVSFARLFSDGGWEVRVVDRCFTVPPVGLEPTRFGLKVRCSTN